MPFTSLDAAPGVTSGADMASGVNQSGARGLSGARSSLSGANNPGSLIGAGGFMDAHMGGFAPSSSNTMGRMSVVNPLASPFGGQVAPQASLPYDVSAMRQPALQSQSLASANMLGATPHSAAPVEAPPQPADLRATLPGSRMTEPPSNALTRDGRSRLWIVIAALLIVMLVAVVILLRWLEAGQAGFMLFALR